MVTLTNWFGKPNSNISEFVGLSTDSKPIDTYNDLAVTNGSTFFCMDNGDMYMYDEENKTWYKL